MLANTTRDINASSGRITLTSRRAVKAVANLGITPEAACPAGWRDTAAFAALLSPRLAEAPADLALLWVHEDGYPSLLWLIQRLLIQPVLIIHVLGSSAGDPREGNVEALQTLAGRRYVTVVLGSKPLPRAAMAHRDEISAGAIEAIQTGRREVEKCVSKRSPRLLHFAR